MICKAHLLKTEMLSRAADEVSASSWPSRVIREHSRGDEAQAGDEISGGFGVS
jgi:hypothetical protein